MARGLAVLLLTGSLALAALDARAAPGPVTLRIVFPEGFSARQMADRVSGGGENGCAGGGKAVNRKGHVPPRLNGVAYKAAAGRARAPSPFRPYLKRRSVE